MTWMSKYILHKMMNVSTYRWLNLSWSFFVKGESLRYEKNSNNTLNLLICVYGFSTLNGVVNFNWLYFIKGGHCIKKVFITNKNWQCLPNRNFMNKLTIKETCWGPFYHELTLIPAWISNYMISKRWGEMTLISIPNLQRLYRLCVGIDKYVHTTHYNGYNYISTLGLKLIHVTTT